MCSAGGSWELLCLCLHPCQWGLGWLPFLWGRRRKEQSYGVKLFITEAANCCDMCRATGFLFYFLLLGITVERCPNPPLAWSWRLVGRRLQAAGLPAMSTAREHWETLSAWLLWAGLTAGLLHGCTVCSSSHPWAVSVQLPGSAHTPAPPALPGGWGEMPRRCGFVGVMIALLIQILETNKQKTNPKQRQRHTANIQAVTGWMSKDLCCVTFSDGCACAVCRKLHVCVWTPIRHWSSSSRQAGSEGPSVPLPCACGAGAAYPQVSLGKLESQQTQEVLSRAYFLAHSSAQLVACSFRRAVQQRTGCEEPWYMLVWNHSDLVWRRCRVKPCHNAAFMHSDRKSLIE